MDRPPIPDAILTGRVVAIARNLDVDRALRIGGVLATAGVPAFEVTLQGPGAIDAIAALRGTLGARLLVGAGTVLDIEGAEAAIGAGAAFLVMPVTDVALIRWAADRACPCSRVP